MRLSLTDDTHDNEYRIVQIDKKRLVLTFVYLPDETTAGELIFEKKKQSYHHTTQQLTIYQHKTAMTVRKTTVMATIIPSYIKLVNQLYINHLLLPHNNKSPSSSAYSARYSASKACRN